MILNEFGDGRTMDGDIVALKPFRIIYFGLIGVCMVSDIARLKCVGSSEKENVLLVIPYCKMIHSQCPCRPMIIVCKTPRMENFDHGRHSRWLHEYEVSKAVSVYTKKNL